MAYARLGNAYANLDESGLADSNARKAFELRDRTSERERLYIEAHYYGSATGNLETIIQIYREWLQIYPRDDTALGNISVHYLQLGRYEEALTYARKRLEAAPGESAAYIDLAQVLLALNRLDEADAVLQQMKARKLYLEDEPQLEYLIAFLKGDTARMHELASQALRSPGDDAGLLPFQSDTEFYYGRLQHARELNRKATEALRRHGEKETAALWEADAALWEAECGNQARAQGHAASALKTTRSRAVEALAALGLARAGATSQAQKLAAQPNEQFPSDTILNGYWLPSIRAAIELDHGRTAQAIQALEPAAQYELGATAPVPSENLYPIYLRGLAFLAAHDGARAAAEFQKLLDHPGLATNSVLAALAHLGLARSYAIEGAQARSRSAYQTFLILWRDADPVPHPLRQARLEYSKLK